MEFCILMARVTNDNLITGTCFVVTEWRSYYRAPGLNTELGFLGWVFYV